MPINPADIVPKAALVVPLEAGLNSDGSRLAYKTRYFDSGSKAFQTEVRVHEFLSRRDLTLDVEGLNLRLPTWRPQANALAVVASNGTSESVWLVDLNDHQRGETKLATFNCVQGLSWSPDGERICVSGVAPSIGEPWALRFSDLGLKRAGRYISGKPKLWLVKVDGTVSALTSGSGSDYSPIWCDDGHIAYLHLPEDRELEILDLRVGAIGEASLTKSIDLGIRGFESRISVSGTTRDLVIAESRPSFSFDLTPERLLVGSPERGFTNLLSGWTGRLGMRLSSDLHSPRPGSIHASNGELWFLGTDAGRCSIYSMPETGGRPVPRLAGDHCVSCYSAAGNQIAFVSETAARPPEVFAGSVVEGQIVAQRVTRLNTGDHFVRHHRVDATVSEIAGQADCVGTVAVVGEGPSLTWGNAFHSEFTGLVAAGYRILAIDPEWPKTPLGLRDTARKISESMDVAIQAAGSRQVAVMGHGFGGLVSCWIAIERKDLQALIVRGGGCNLLSLSFSGEAGWGIAEKADLPDPLDQPMLYVQASPLLHLQQVKAPVLVQHGEYDSVFPLDQGEQIFNSVIYFGGRGRLVVYPKEIAHQIELDGTVANQIDHFQLMLAWLEMSDAPASRKA